MLLPLLLDKIEEDNGMAKVNISFDAYCSDMTIVGQVMGVLAAEGIDYTVRFDADNQRYNLYGSTNSRLVDKVSDLLGGNEWVDY
jgi:hypothetical protein